MKKIVFLILFLIAGLAAILWHGRTNEVRSEKLFIMDTFVEMMAEGSEEKATVAMKKAADELKRIDTRLGYQNSLIDELNRNHTIRDGEVFFLIRRSREIHDESSGAFSITLRPALDAWGFTGLHPYRLPTPSEFDSWKKALTDADLQLFSDRSTIKTPPGMLIDLGGITKGYAADRACEAMKASGIETGLVNAGGDIMVFGDRTWKVGIKHPRGAGIFSVIQVRNRAIATSGDYERFFIQGSKRYCHILDPATGWPARVCISATVLAESCILADAWATALFVKGPDKLGALLEKKGIDWITVDEKGSIRTSSRLRPYCPERIALKE